MNMKRLLTSFLIILTSFNKAFTQKFAVTVENGVNLDDIHCPGTISLFCVASGLPVLLRWHFNQSEIIDYSPTSRGNVTKSQSGLTNINSAFANVTYVVFDHQVESTLTVDFQQLYQQKITNISCGDSINSTTLSFNGILRGPTSPSVMSAVLFYQNELLKSFDVQWIQLEPVCEGESFYYLFNVVNTTGFEQKTFSKNVTCERVYCTSTFHISELPFLEEYPILFEVAAISRYSNSTSIFPLEINYSSQDYFVTEVNFTSCPYAVTVKCVSVFGPDHGSCTMHYSNNGIPSQIEIRMNTLKALPFLRPNMTYSIEFSVLLNDSFLIRNVMQLMTPNTNEYSAWYGGREIATLCITSVFIVCFVAHIILHLSLLQWNRFKVKKFIHITASVGFCLPFVVCLILLLLFISIGNDPCNANKRSLLDVMLAISCIGITSIVFFWICIICTLKQIMAGKIESNKNNNVQSVLRNSNEPRLSVNQLQVDNQDSEVSMVADNVSYEPSKISYQEASMAADNAHYEPLKFSQQENSYSFLKHASRCLTESESRVKTHENINNEEYDQLDKDVTFESSTYEQLRADKKSKAVPNLLDPTYTHLGKRQVQPQSISDTINSLKSENQREDYDVLAHSVMLETSATISGNLHLSGMEYEPCYDNLDMASIDTHRGECVYDQLRPGQKSKAVPNMNDPNYSHVSVHVENEKPKHHHTKAKKWQLWKSS